MVTYISKQSSANVPTTNCVNCKPDLIDYFLFQPGRQENLILTWSQCVSLFSFFILLFMDISLSRKVCDTCSILIQTCTYSSVMASIARKILITVLKRLKKTDFLHTNQQLQNKAANAGHYTREQRAIRQRLIINNNNNNHKVTCSLRGTTWLAGKNAWLKHLWFLNRLFLT